MICLPVKQELGYEGYIGEMRRERGRGTGGIQKFASIGVISARMSSMDLFERSVPLGPSSVLSTGSCPEHYLSLCLRKDAAIAGGRVVRTLWLAFIAVTLILSESPRLARFRNTNG